MADVKYTHIMTDFLNDVCYAGGLGEEIEASSITTALSYINTSPSACDIYFESALSGPEWATLSGVIAAHDGMEPMVDAGLVLTPDGVGSIYWDEIVVISGAVTNVDLQQVIEVVATVSGAVDGAVAGITTLSGVVQNFIDNIYETITVTSGTLQSQIDDLDGPKNRKYLIWGQSPNFNGELDLLGWYDSLYTDQVIDSDTPYVCDVAGFHSHYVFNFTSTSGTPFTLTVSGTIVDEATGVYSSSVEDITVSGTGYYQSAASFIDNPTLTIVEDNKSGTFDLWRTTYWDNGNTDFTVRGCRLEWVPDSNIWEIEVNILKIHDDGSVETIDHIHFTNDDEVQRADRHIHGKYKRTDYNKFCNGENNEGLIILMNQTSLNHFHLFLQYE